VVSSSRFKNMAALEAWQACATTLPRGQPCSVQRSLRSTTYCTTGSLAAAGSEPPVALAAATVEGMEAEGDASSLPLMLEDGEERNLPEIGPREEVAAGGVGSRAGWRCRDAAAVAAEEAMDRWPFSLEPTANIEQLCMLLNGAEKGPMQSEERSGERKGVNFCT
jgi:hypothetical protein